MTKPTRIWKYLNIAVLISLITISALGTFYKHISFGWGLADYFGYAILYLTTVIHLVLIMTAKANEQKRLSIIFLPLTVFICLKATLWRGSEYRWNGHLFYEPPKAGIIFDQK